MPYSISELEVFSINNKPYAYPVQSLNLEGDTITLTCLSETGAENIKRSFSNVQTILTLEENIENRPRFKLEEINKTTLKFSKDPKGTLTFLFHHHAISAMTKKECLDYLSPTPPANSSVSPHQSIQQSPSSKATGKP